jgi:LPS O-antigen subunit length determinant protein (WzzB/FepE family)
MGRKKNSKPIKKESPKRLTLTEIVVIVSGAITAIGALLTGLASLLSALK